MEKRILKFVLLVTIITMVKNVVAEDFEVNYMRISVKIDEILPVIEEAVREKLGISDDVRLTYTSKTTFLTFDTDESEVK